VRKLEGERARQLEGRQARAAGRADGRTWKAKIVDAKWWEGLHICKGSTSICKVNQIANLTCKTIGGVFSALFCK